MPRHYVEREDDLRALRGRLDITRQFTVHAARPDRLACRFDSLENDTPLMRVMKACVVMLSRHARGLETQRLLAELRHALDGIADTPVSISAMETHPHQPQQPTLAQPARSGQTVPAA
jgi:5-methylcytosine-specific restriction enzyme subunit McrC